jgi:hypothetical protein
VIDYQAHGLPSLETQTPISFWRLNVIISPCLLAFVLCHFLANLSAGEKFTLEKNEKKEGKMHLGAGLAMPAQMASQNYNNNYRYIWDYACWK